MSETAGGRPDALQQTLDRYPFQIELATRFGDMDSGGHINNVAIVRLFEDARVRMQMEAFGLGTYRQNDRPFRTVVVKSTTQYLRESFFPQPMRCGVGVSRIGNRSYGLVSALFQDGQCVAVQDTVMVLLGDQQALPIGAAQRERLQSFEFGGRHTAGG